MPEKDWLIVPGVEEACRYWPECGTRREMKRVRGWGQASEAAMAAEAKVTNTHAGALHPLLLFLFRLLT